LGNGDCREIVRKFEPQPGNLIPVLHELQDKMGHLTEEAMHEVSSWLSVPVSDVYGTASFYTMFSTEAKGDYIIRLCDSPPCHLEKSKTIRRALEKELGVKAGETTEDGKFTLEVVSCFGLCGVAPAIMINQEAYGNLTADMLPGILAKYRREEA
jgi:NADH:ubiquinone oxidoreductase subunit E